MITYCYIWPLSSKEFKVLNEIAIRECLPFLYLPFNEYLSLNPQEDKV